MSQQATQNPSNTSPTSNLTDFTALASALNEVAQALLNHSPKCKTIEQEPSEEDLDVQSSSVPAQALSKRAKRIKRYKECYYEPKDTTAFADKDIAQSFEKAYNNGNFHDEVRYYYIPAHVVRQEYKLLKQHQHKDILSLFFDIHNELNLRSRLIACVDKDKDLQDISLAQLGESMLPTLKLLHTIYEHLSTFKLVHKTMLSKRHKG